MTGSGVSGIQKVDTVSKISKYEFFKSKYIIGQSIQCLEKTLKDRSKKNKSYK